MNLLFKKKNFSAFALKSSTTTSTKKKVPIELTEQTATLPDVKRILTAKTGPTDFYVLDAKFDVVYDEKFTRSRVEAFSQHRFLLKLFCFIFKIFFSFNTTNKKLDELYWSIRNKFYYVDKLEWNAFLDENERTCKNSKIGYKKINYPVEIDEELMGSIRPIMYESYPVTGPSEFRRMFTELRIVNDQIYKYKNVSK